MNLKLRIALLVLAASLAVGLGGAAWTTVYLQDVLIKDLSDRGDSIGTALAETLIGNLVQRDQVSVIHGLRRLLAASEDIAYIYVTDFDGALFGHSFEGGFPPELDTDSDAGAAVVGATHRQLTFEAQQILEVTKPLIAGMGARVTIGMDTRGLQRQIEETALLIVGASLLIGAVVALLGSYFGRRLALPIETLAEQMGRYGRGETVPPETVSHLSGSRETELLAQRFADMIRQRQRFEAELSQVKQTLDNTTDAVFMFYPDTLKFFYANRGALQQTGYGRNEMLEMTPVDIKPRLDEAGFRRLLRPLLTGERDSMTFETVHRHKSGHDIPVEIFLQYMADGEPPHFLAMVRDITERRQAEAELNQIKETLDNTLDAVFMFYPDTLQFSYVNRGALQQLGYSSSELLEMTPVAIKPDYDEAAFRALVKPLLAGTRDSLTFETVHRHKSGRHIPVEIFLQYMARGEPPHFLAIVRDISERKRAQAALQASTLQLRSVVTAAPLVLWSWDKNGVFTLSEGSGLTHLGLAPGQVVGQSVFDVYSDVPQLLSAAKRSLAGESFVEESEVGGRLWQAHYQPWHGERGELLGTIGVAVDITERQLAERQLREERNFSKTVLDNAGALILVLDRDGRIQQFNSACEGLTGYHLAEVEGRFPWDFLLLPEERDRVREQAFEAMAHNPQRLSGHYVNHWLTKDGRQRLIEWSNTALLDDQGRFDHLVSIGIDITERSQAEEALQRLNDELEQRVAERTAELADSNTQLRDALQTLQLAQDELVRSEKLASLGSLVAGVAHELNTPLGNSVTVGTTLQEWLRDFRRALHADTLRRSTLDEFVQHAEDATQLLIRNLARAAELIADFKQVAVDQTSAQRREFELQRVITEVIETLQPQFKKTPHQIEVTVPAGIRMDSYPGPLGQVITNLALNALLHGFTEDMHGKLEITARELPEQRVELVISDNGRGIPADHLGRVFDPFFTTRLGKGGSGLGLHIVYTLVTRVLGGSIAVASPPDSGARLTIQLPRIAPHTDAAGQPAGTA